MMKWLVRSSIKFRGLVVAAALAAIAVGVVQLREVQVEPLPEFSPPYVEVQTEALGLSAYEVEQLITVPLEVNLLNGVAWLDEIRSNSVAGLSSIELIFEPGTDLLRARQMVQERLTQAHTLPNVSRPPAMLQPLSSVNRVAMISLSSEQLSLIEMSVLARWNVKPRLMGVPGVANVAIWGQRERQLQVQVDPQRLAAHGVSLDRVLSTTGNALWSSPLSFVRASSPGSGGFIDTPQQRLGIQHISPIKTAADLAQVPVEPAAGEKDAKSVTLGDVGRVVEDNQPLIGDAVVGDGGKGLMLIVEKFPGASTTQVTRDVEAALKALSPGLSGMKFDSTLYRPATFIEQATDNLALSLGLGLVLLVLVVAALLFRWRTALIVVIVVPLSLLAAFLVLQLRGEPINLLVVAGLVVALAVVVDDAVTGATHVGRRLAEYRPDNGGKPVATLILEAMRELRSPIVYATLAILLAAVPLFFLGGVTGTFLGSVATSYVLAVAASLLVALTVTPALASFLLARPVAMGREPAFAGRMRRSYQAVLSRATLRSRWVYAVAALVAVAGVAVTVFAVVPRAGAAPIPDLQDRDLLVRWQTPPGTSHPAMVAMGEQVGRDLRAVPGVRRVAAHVGRAIAADEVVNINSGMLWVSLNGDADYAATVAAVRRVLQGRPGFEGGLRTYAGEVIAAAEGRQADGVVVRVYGRDLDVLKTEAEKVRQSAAAVPGVRGSRVELPPVEPTVEVEVNIPRARQDGLKPGDVRRAAATYLAGIEVGSLFENQKVFEVVVIGVPGARQSLASVSEVPVDTPDGRRVRLGDVAEVRVQPNQNVFTHEATARYYDVVLDVAGGDRGAVAAQVEQRLAGLALPLEYHAEVLGDYAGDGARTLRLAGLLLFVVVLLLLLLHAAVGAWRLALLVALTLPVALAGAVVAAALTGAALTPVVLAGVLGVLAIAIRVSIVTIGHLRRLGEREDGQITPELVVRGAGERAGAVLVAAVAVAAVLLPAMVMGGPGLEVVRPLAFVLVGGLVTVLLHGLLVVPLLYLHLAPRRPGAQPGDDLELSVSMARD
ncbi:efflux RND transporter permease subunit [Nonomuraea sp. NN258]|uniref:efflux RND transporter permease subunit n=1 Tax=Nonomuraea antri TaxID=2730852 RepID=UPI00156916C8|nr:efflux RND transporter permease subunit [Nonomuraea antri]NRQ31155.1 efflux RND transporter permease subunit [Nonomuraea antri]